MVARCKGNTSAYFFRRSTRVTFPTAVHSSIHSFDANMVLDPYKVPITNDPVHSLNIESCAVMLMLLEDIGVVGECYQTSISKAFDTETTSSKKVSNEPKLLYRRQVGNAISLTPHQSFSTPPRPLSRLLLIQLFDVQLSRTLRTPCSRLLTMAPMLSGRKTQCHRMPNLHKQTHQTSPQIPVYL